MVAGLGISSLCRAADYSKMRKRAFTWRRLTALLTCGVFAFVAARKVWNQEYIHASVAGALAAIYLALGFRGAKEIAPSIADSTSEISDFLAGSENGQDV